MVSSAAGKKSTRRSRKASEEEAESVDTVLTALEKVVADLETGDLPPEKALERFEEGVKHARRGQQLLDSVEQKIEMLLSSDSDSERVSFEGYSAAATEGGLDQEEDDDTL